MFPSNKRTRSTDAANHATSARTNTSTGLTAAPSGIAQLRNSTDHSSEHPADPMNLDDFIVPTSVASPAGIMDAPNDQSGQQSVPQAHGIPINTRERPQIKIATGVPALSVPKSSIALNRTSEFDYVQRRVRKTSIDERRVCQLADTLYCD